MARALETQMELKEARELSFEERLAMLLDAECISQHNKSTESRLRTAKLKLPACMEDVRIIANRGLDRSLLTSLASCDWIRDKQNILITGSTGAGKTYLACALANAACRHELSTIYYRIPTLFDDLVIAKADGSYKRLVNTTIGNKKLLVLDDFGLCAMTPENRLDLLEIMERRYDISSTIITSQFDTDHWHDLIGDPTIADAILDRTVHNAHRIKLKGETMRNKKNMETPDDSGK